MIIVTYTNNHVTLIDMANVTMNLIYFKLIISSLGLSIRMKKNVKTITPMKFNF